MFHFFFGKFVRLSIKLYLSSIRVNKVKKKKPETHAVLCRMISYRREQWRMTALFIYDKFLITSKRKKRYF